MTNQIDIAKTPVKDLVKMPSVQRMLSETMHDKASSFKTSIVNIVNDDKALQNVNQMSVIQAAMISSSLNLPINKNLGYIWLVPYWDRDKKCKMAQAQVGYKGYIQLALRTGQYERLNAIEVHDGEMTAWDPLTEDFAFDVTQRKSDKVVGYAGYLKLISGFIKTIYWSKDEMEQHRQKFSASKGGPWKTDYDAMAKKTVIRNMLTKWGIMSTEMIDAYDKDGSEVTPQDIEAEETDNDPKEITDISQLGKGKENAENNQSADSSNSKSSENAHNDNYKQKNTKNDQGKKLDGKDSGNNGNV